MRILLISVRSVAVLFVSLTVVVSACQAREEPGQQAPPLVHPSAENIPRDDEVADVIEREIREARAQGAEERALGALARRLSSAKEVRSVGVLRGEKEDMIGKVADIGVYDDAVYLLDSRYNEVKVYDLQGDLQQTFGGHGQGPGEFTLPRTISVDRGQVVVADQGSARFNVFKREGASFSLDNTVAYGMGPIDLCTLENRIYLRGVHPERDAGSVQVYSATGHLEQSFGHTYRASSPMVRLRLSEGPIACNEEAQAIVVGFSHLPVLYGYTPQGEIRWTSKLAEFSPIEITSASGRMSFDGGGKATDFVREITPVPGGYVLVQVSHRTPESMKAKKHASVDTYLVSAERGHGVYVGQHLPYVYAVTPDRIFAGLNDPYPQMKIYTY